MKTKIIWEPSDVQVGRWVYKAGDMGPVMCSLQSPEHLDYYISTAHIIGFIIHPDSPNTYPLVSLADGMTYRANGDVDELVETLTANDYIPLPPELLVKLIQRKFKLSTLAQS